MPRVEILFECGEQSLMPRQSNGWQRTDRVWWMPPEPGGEIARLAEWVGLPLPLAQILYQRGLHTAEQVAAFFAAAPDTLHDPFLMKGMREGVARIAQAIAQNERIRIYGDYDVDGQTGTALLIEALRRLGGRVDYFIPHRIDEGYGLQAERIRQFAGDIDLLLTVDCGITSIEEVAEAQALGIDVIVTDHHEPGPELPQAVAVINPKRPDCPYPEKRLAGCGVALKLVEALYRICGETTRPIEEWVDLVALGTIADVVPLVGENRVFVCQGLPRLRERLGLSALIEVAGIQQETPSAGQVAFLVAPRLNAAGRMAEASVAVELLLTDDPEEAARIAGELDAENQRRREVEQQTLREAEEWVETYADLDTDRALIVEGEGWHPGVIGIVASRLVERYHRPVIVVSRDGDEAVGSGRSIEGFDLHDALQEVQHLLVRFGGHAAAAGLTVRCEQIAAFRDAFQQVAAARLSADDLLPRLRIDGVLPPAQIDAAFATAVERLAPFGVGNAEPVFAVHGLRVVESRAVGKEQQHWRLVVQDAQGEMLEGIGFDMAPTMAARFHPGDAVQVAASVSLSEWNGRTRVQLRLRDVRPAELLEDGVQLEAALRRVVGRGPAELAADAHSVKPKRAGWAAQPTFDGEGVGAEVCVIDLRGEGDDPRLRALQRGSTAETLLVWAAPGQGLEGEGRSWLRVETREGVGRGLLCLGGVPPAAAAVRRSERLSLVFWDLPYDEEQFALALRHASTWAERIDLYLTFTPERVRQAVEQVELDYPRIELLRRIYLHLRQRCDAGVRPLPLRPFADEVRRAGVAVSRAGIEYALLLFAEAGLLRIASWEAAQPVVELLSTEGRKVDLRSAVRYNEAEARRARIARFGDRALSTAGPELVAWALGMKDEGSTEIPSAL